MPPKKKVLNAPPSTVKELKDLLWKSADKLRGSMDASGYKDVVLGLVFLKYVSDAFSERRAQISDELAELGMSPADIALDLDDVDEYTAHGVFWVPETARWEYLSQNAKGVTTTAGHKPIGGLIDDAMRDIMEANPTLARTLPTIFNRESVDQRRLGELIDMFNSITFAGLDSKNARDVLGEVYEYFLAKFASAEGKRGGEFYTPASVVRVLTEILEPYEGRVYDPACGSGGMFVQAGKLLEAHNLDTQRIAIYGQELNERTWRLAKMNLAIHGLTGHLGERWNDTFAVDVHAGIQMDVVMANPPFNVKDWHRNEDDPRWKYGVPPAGNANFGWVQHMLSKLNSNGVMGVVLANGSMTSNSGGEGEIRRNLVENDLVSCMVALPTQLFRSTGIPVCLWFFARDKSAAGRGSVDRRGQVLFIDARELGTMVDRTERVLTDEDVAKLADTFHNWRGTGSATGAYEDVAGFCRSATLQEIKEADYALTPGRYVGAAEVEEDDEPITEKIARLKSELLTQMDEVSRLGDVVRKQLERIDD